MSIVIFYAFFCIGIEATIRETNNEPYNVPIVAVEEGSPAFPFPHRP